MRWLRDLRTYRMLRADPLLALATLVLSASVISPIFATPFLPLVDLGSTVGAANLLDDAAFGHGVIARHYFVNHALVPYWTVYLVLALLEHVVGPVLAIKLVVAAIVVGVPLAAMRLLVALGRSPRLGLLVFLLSWDTNLYWGWITFHCGMAVGLYLLARLIEMESMRDAWKIFPLGIFVALTHVHAVVMVLVAGGLLGLSRRPFWPNVARHALALSGSVCVLAPWAWQKVLGGAPSGAAGHYSFEQHSVANKLRQLLSYTIDNAPEHAPNAAAIGFALIVVGAAGMALLPQREVASRLRVASFLIFVALAGLYFALPFAISGPVYHWWTYPRFGTYLLIALLTLPRPALERWAALALVPALVTALVVHGAIREQFALYGRYTAPYQRIIAALPSGQRFFPLDLDDWRFKGTREAVLGQLHGYAAAVKSGYDPHLFDELNNPLLFRRAAMLPVPNWRRQSEFTMESVGRFYDYVIVHPLERDPFARNRRERDAVKLVKQAGQWRLYKVRAPVAEAR